MNVHSLLCSNPNCCTLFLFIGREAPCPRCRSAAFAPANFARESHAGFDDRFRRGFDWVVARGGEVARRFWYALVELLGQALARMTMRKLGFAL